jgi:hypothetical protein
MRPAWNIDHAVTGVGETPTKTQAKYRVKPAEYSYSISLKPFRVQDKTPVELGRRARRQ